MTFWPTFWVTATILYILGFIVFMIRMDRNLRKRLKQEWQNYLIRENYLSQIPRTGRGIGEPSRINQ